MSDASLQDLMAALKSPDEDVRDRATQELWHRWFTQKGAQGLSKLQEAQDLVDVGHYLKAEQILTILIEAQPDFAEAWNRRAVLQYTRRYYRKALADCQQVVAMVPFHFGALHGMGLCHAALGEYREAIAAFRRALEVQPHALVNQRLILECTARLS